MSKASRISASRIRAIEAALEKVSREYQAAKARFNAARIDFETIREQLAATKKLALQVVTLQEWHAWLDTTEDGQAIAYAGLPIGEAILGVLRAHVYDQAERVADTKKSAEFKPWMTLSEITRALENGGFEFKSVTPLREVNAALIRLAGVEKSGHRYQIEKTDEAFRYAEMWMDSH